MNEDEKARIAAALGASRVVDLKQDERVRVMVDAMYAPEDPPGELVPMHRQILGEVFADKATRAIAALEAAGFYVGRLEVIEDKWFRSSVRDVVIAGGRPLFRKVEP